MNKSKENIYNNLGQINVNDTMTVTNTRTSGYVKLTNKCIICGNDCDSLETMVCDDCKEAVEWAKKSIRAAKQQQENTLKEQQENTLKEPEIMCPYCGSKNIKSMYGTIYADGSDHKTHYICNDCHEEFDVHHD